MARPIGIQTSKLIDQLYDESSQYVSGALDHLVKGKDMIKFATKLGRPLDVLNTIRKADLDSKGGLTPLEAPDIEAFSSIARLKKLDKMCEQLGIPKPKDDGSN